MLEPVALHTLKFTVFAVGNGKIMSPSEGATPYPVTLVMSAFGVHVIVSVVAAPVAVAVTAVAHVFAEIELVPSASPEPLATVMVNVELASGNVKVFSLVVGPENFANPLPVPPLADPRIPDTAVD